MLRSHIIPMKKKFHIHSSFKPAGDQPKAIQALVEGVEHGEANQTLLGVTGSGKTFTMTGNQQMPGLIPQGVDALFQQSDIQVSMQYVEIYNEQIKDLLQPSNNDHLDVREAPGKGTFVAGAANVEVSSRDDVEALLEAGNAYRTTESTQLNMVSSRSHAVLQLRIQLGEKKGKLSLIDLAGSERASKTGVMSSTNNIGRGGTNNNTKRLNEGANINRSLLALANCISTLADMVAFQPPEDPEEPDDSEEEMWERQLVDQSPKMEAEVKKKRKRKAEAAVIVTEHEASHTQAG